MSSFFHLCYELFLSHTVIEWLQELLFTPSVIRLIEILLLLLAACSVFLAVMWNVFIYYSITKVRDLLQHGGESFSLPPLFLLWVSSMRENLFCEMLIDAQNAFSRIWWVKILNECGRENEIDHLISSFVAGEVLQQGNVQAAFAEVQGSCFHGVWFPVAEVYRSIR